MITRSRLQRLSEDCASLLFCSECIEGNNTEELMESNRAIKHALRKIIIANEIADRMIICVTGLQGTGKTTLMKNYYDIDDSVMNIAFGRGERIPVFITEEDIRDIQMYAVGVEKDESGYHQKRNPVSSHDFVEFSKAEDEDSTIMYMELMVPRKYVDKSAKVSYMLLPGYERKETYWNTLIEFSVQSADTAIFVMTPESVADANNAQLLEKIKKTFGNNIIYAISHSDLKNDENANIKTTLMELVGADKSQSDRFVCTGAYTDIEKNEKWKKNLQNAIEMFSADPQSMDQKNTEYLEKIIATELRPAVVTIKRFVTDVTEDLLTGFEQSTWLTAFDKSVSNMRKRFQKSLNENFKEAQSQDIKDLQNMMQYGKKHNDDVVDENSGSFMIRIENLLTASKCKTDYLRRSIFGESLEDVKKARKLIDEVMHDENHQYRYVNAFANAITTTTDMLCVKENAENIPQIGASNTRGTLLMAKKEEEKRLILQDVNTILAPGNRKNELVYKGHMPETMRVMVECGTQYFGLRLVDGLYSEQYITMPKLAESNLSKEDIKKSIQDSEKFAMTVLGVTGLDLLGDGVLNFIPALAESIGVAVPAAGAIVAIFVGGGVAKALISDYNKLQLKDYYSYCKAISSVYEEVEKRYLDIYDEFMAEVRSKVERYLIECAGASDTVVNKQNALIAIKNIQEDLNTIRKEMKDDSYDPTKLIRG